MQAVVDSLDSVPEALQEFYQEAEDGKFRLPLEGVETEEAVSGLKSALAKEKEARRKANERLSQLPEDLPDRLERLAALEEAESEREQKQAEKKGEWEKLAAQMKDAHAEEIAAREEIISGLVKELDDNLRRESAILALEEAEASVKVGLPHILQRTETRKGEDGKRRVVVLDDNGDPRIDTKTGDLMTIPQLIAEMKDEPEWAPLFLEPGATGGGATGRRAAGGGKFKPFKEMTEQDKMDFIDEHGQEAYVEHMRKTK